MRRFSALVLLFVAAVTPATAHVLLEAEDFQAMQGIEPNAAGTIGFCDNGDWLQYKDVDLGAGYETFIAFVGAQNEGGRLEVRLDSLTGSLCGTLPIVPTGNWGTLREQSVAITCANGVHDVFIIFKDIYGVGNFDYFRFSDPMGGDSGVPWEAVTAGYDDLVFEDLFDTVGSIDVNHTGEAGYKWYTDRPFGWPPVPAEYYSVSDSVLTVKGGGGTCLSSYSKKERTGHAFRYAFFEASLRFNPIPASPDFAWFPCWWSFSVAHTVGDNNEYWGELDFFEAYPTGDPRRFTGRFLGSVHDWRDGGNTRYLNRNHAYQLPEETNFSQWHKYGCLWTPGRIRWFFDDQLLITQYYSNGQPIPQSNPPGPDGTFSVLDGEEMLLILGGSEGFPMDVDWVRVWQADGDTTSTSRVIWSGLK